MSLQRMLRSLEEAGLIHPITQSRGAVFEFHHELIHTTTYASLLKADRRSLHLAVGETIEKLLTDQSEDQAALIAKHFDEAGDDERALKYYLKAGNVASRQYANAEAILLYHRALEIARKILNNYKLLQEIYLSLGRELELGGRYGEALDTYAQMQVDARNKGDQDFEFSALMAHAKIYATPNPEQNADLAQQLLEQALTYTRKTENRAEEARVLWNLLVLNVYGNGDYTQAIQFGEKALMLAREYNLEELSAFILNDLTYAYFGSDQTLLAQKTQREAAILWRHLNNLPMLVDSLSISVPITYLLGDYKRAIRESEEALELSQKAGNQWGQAGSLAFIGLAYHELGLIDQGIATYQKAFELGKITKHRGAFIGSRSLYAWLLADLGEVNQALKIADQAYQDALANQTLYLSGWVLMIKIHLHLRNNDLPKAQAALHSLRQIDQPTGLRWFTPIFTPLGEAEIFLKTHDYPATIRTSDKFLKYLEQTGIRTFTPDALALKSQAQIEMGYLEDAWQTLLRARRIAEELGSQRSLWPILSRLAKLSEASGDQHTAQHLRGRTREVLQYVLDHIGSVDLRNSFTNRPEVREHLQA